MLRLKFHITIFDREIGEWRLHNAAVNPHNFNCFWYNITLFVCVSFVKKPANFRFLHVLFARARMHVCARPCARLCAHARANNPHRSKL